MLPSLTVSIPYGKGKAEELQNMKVRFAYQFPMGKVKVAESTEEPTETTTVSIPYGKGKDRKFQANINALLYQFPMGKVKTTRMILGTAQTIVSIPYGKGKAWDRF